MTRISSMLLASTLAILPISAFAQQAAAPVTTAGPASLTAAAPNTDKTITGTTVMDKATTPAPVANTTQPAKTDAKTTSHGVKNDVHGMNGAPAPHAKAGVVTKTTEPAKS